MLAASPLVSTREGLLEQVMEGLGEPAGRPRGLATWLEGFRTQTMTTPMLFPAGSAYPARPAVRWRHRRGGGRVLIGAVSALALLVGRRESPWPSPASTRQADAVARGSPVTTPARTTTAAGTMPNVVGSSVDSVTAQLTASGLPPPTVLEEIDTKVTDGQVLSQTPAAGTAHPNADRAGRGARPGRDLPAGPLGGQRRPGPRSAQRRGPHVPPLDLLDHRDAATSARPSSTTWASTTGSCWPRSGWTTPRSTPAARSSSRRSWTPGPSSPRPSGWARPCPCA